MPLVRVLSFLLVLAPLFWCNAVAGERLTVFVSIAPQKYFVQQIGKDLLGINVMVQPGESPATYEPKPKQMAALSQAQIYFAIGVPFEKVWLEKIAAANPKMTVIPTQRGIKKIPMAVQHHHDEKAGHRDDDSMENNPGDDNGLDPHIWLSPPLVKLQARTILAALQTVDPAHAKAYAANCAQFVSRINALDDRLKQTFANKNGARFMVFHPAWGYFARTYGLKQVPIEMEGKNPKPAQLKALIELAREKGIQVIFVQPQFSTKSAALVAKEINGQVALADPLAEDWLANLQQVADMFGATLK